MIIALQERQETNIEQSARRKLSVRNGLVLELFAPQRGATFWESDRAAMRRRRQLLVHTLPLNTLRVARQAKNYCFVKIDFGLSCRGTSKNLSSPGPQPLFKTAFSLTDPRKGNSDWTDECRTINFRSVRRASVTVSRPRFPRQAEPDPCGTARKQQAGKINRTIKNTAILHLNELNVGSLFTLVVHCGHGLPVIVHLRVGKSCGGLYDAAGSVADQTMQHENGDCIVRDEDVISQAHSPQLQVVTQENRKA